MLYVEKNSQLQEAHPRSALRNLLLVILAALAITYMPGLPKGGALGHEFGAENVRFPVHLPLQRPIYLARGESVLLHYGVAVRAGAVRLNVRAEANLFSLIFDPKHASLATFTQDGKGSLRYTAVENGYYWFSISPNATKETSHVCTDMVQDLTDALMAAKSDCPVYNSSYYLLIV